MGRREKAPVGAGTYFTTKARQRGPEGELVRRSEALDENFMIHWNAVTITTAVTINSQRPKSGILIAIMIAMIPSMAATIIPAVVG